MRLPKLYQVVNVTFNSLRFNGQFEDDEIITRKARRVLCDDGWEWQIIEGCSPFGIVVWFCHSGFCHWLYLRYLSQV